VLDISVLGPLEVRRDGERVAIPGGKSAELLVRLALEVGAIVSTDRLVDELWSGELETRRNTLQSKVTRLRRALADPSLIAGSPEGYCLTVAPECIDAVVVERDAVAAARLLVGGDAAAAADVSAGGRARFHGSLLPTARDAEWVTPHRVRFEELHARLTESYFTAWLALGSAGDLIGDLETSVSTFPFRESLWQLLITALYRAGRQADALAAYQRVRATLAEELGLEPGPGLRQLEQQILVHDAVLGVDVRQEPPTLGPRPGNLPSMAVELVGRDADVAAVLAQLGGERFVEVLGVGGVGKTALAIAVADAWSRTTQDRPRGAWLARLEAAVTKSEVGDVLIAAFGVSGGEAALFERLRTVEGVLVLDNCEHVADAAASTAMRILDAAPGLRILATSQVALEVDAGARYELAPLELADATELFIRRAVAQRGTRGAVDEAAVLDVCRSLDGLPLAIELAAARTKTLPLDEITRRLDDRFAVLRDPMSSKPERRRALKATIGWSYELLFPDDKRGLWALSAFAGGASLPAVEFVLESGLGVPGGAAIDVVGRLAARSLVIIDDETALTFRYRLLDSIRAFALEAATTEGRREHTLDAHARWFADLAYRSTAGVRSREQSEFLAVARTERANIDAAIGWCAAHDPKRALAIVNGFGWAWVVLGDSRGAQRIRAALESVGADAPPADRAVAHLLAGWIEASTGDLAPAEQDISSACELAHALGDADLQARCSYYLAYVISHRGEWHRALELTDAADARYAGLDRPWDQAANWLFASRAAISAGDRVRARAARDQVLHWLALVDDPWLHARAEAMLGELARLEHRFDDAVAHIGRAAQQSRQLGFRQTEAYQVSSLGRAQGQAGDDQTAAGTLALAIEKAEATGDVRLAALVRVHLGRVLRALGRTTEARAALESASAWHHAAGGGEQYALGECLLAALDAADGAPDAGGRLAALLDNARHDDDAPVEVFALDALARLASERGDDSEATALRAAADERFPAAAHFITARDRVDRPALPESA
jgi:predicted ATPase/DNA-binding SARP family transcriptional activator